MSCPAESTRPDQKSSANTQNPQPDLDGALRAALESPDNPQAMHALALAYACECEWEAARRSMERALALSSTQAGWWRDYGVILLRQRRPQEAMEAHWRSLE